MTALVGRVEERVVAAGSKSEMPAIVLVLDEPDQPDVVLRRREAVALSAEPELARWVGQRVRVHGQRAWSSFVVDSVDLLD